jgi:hypothetical protein
MRSICTSIVATLVLAGTSFADTIHVPDDYTTIQEAIDVSNDGDEIIVAPGIYTGTGDHVVDLKGKKIWLRSSHGPTTTIIQGEGIRRCIYCGSGETLETIIDGFTVSGGRAAAGPGITCHYVDATIMNCIITGNESWHIGGGIALNGSQAEIIDCEITSNWANLGGGIYSREWGVPIISGCFIANNIASNSGGGIGTSSSWPHLSDNWFCENDPSHVSGNWHDDGGNVFTNECVHPCPADLDESGSVDILDLLAVIDSWGTCENCSADIDENGSVNILDLLAVIAQWGLCL